MFREISVLDDDLGLMTIGGSVGEDHDSGSNGGSWEDSNIFSENATCLRL